MATSTPSCRRSTTSRLDRPLRVGVYGAGNFANTQHLPNLTRIGGVRVVAVCDIDAQAARDTAARFDIPGVHTDGMAMLDQESLDALWSIVPAGARGDVEAAAAERGIHLFSEKPQATEMRTARRIDAAIRRGRVLSTVCFRERYRPIFQEAKRLLEDKEVVHIRFQSFRDLPARDTSDPYIRSYGAAFFDWGPHAVDYCRFMSGLDIKTAQAFMTDRPPYRTPVSASFNFAMINGATMTMTFVCGYRGSPANEPYFLICFEGGYLGVHGYERIEMNGRTVYEAEDFNPWFELDRRFCEAVRTGDGSALLNDYHDGLYTLAPLLAGWESARRGGEPIDVAEFMSS